MSKKIIPLVLTVLVVSASLLFFYDSFMEKPLAKKKFPNQREVNGEWIRYDLVDPEMAPQALYSEVMRGYHIVLNTRQILPEYVDDRLSCSNCHIAAGNTLGGKEGGISLVGVVKVYPQFSDRDGKEIDLIDRINNCFERSMNGKPLPRHSSDMQAIIAYLEWISSNIPDRKNYPWLGLKIFKNEHQPDPKQGALIYAQNCALCHQLDGGGTFNNPPVWGPHSFNDGAGMSTLPMLSAFIYENMPYENPFLTQEQALDVGAYLIEQRRPKFINETN